METPAQHLLGRVAEDHLGSLVPHLHLVVVVDEDDGVHRVLNHRGDQFLLLTHPNLQRPRRPVLIDRNEQGKTEHHGDHGDLDEQVPVAHLLYGCGHLAGGRRNGHRPEFRRGEGGGPHRGVGDQLGDLSLDPAVPAAHIVSAPFLPLEHSLLHDPVDLVEADVGLSLGTGCEGVLADERLIRVVQEGSLLIDRPRVAGLAGTDALGGRSHKPGYVDHPVEDPSCEGLSFYG